MGPTHIGIVLNLVEINRQTNLATTTVTAPRMWWCTWRLQSVCGPETGKRKLVTRKADGKLTESWRKADAFGEFKGVLARKADAFGYPFQLTHFSLPISGPLKLQPFMSCQCLQIRLRFSRCLAASREEGWSTWARWWACRGCWRRSWRAGRSWAWWGRYRSGETPPETYGSVSYGARALAAARFTRSRASHARHRQWKNMMETKNEGLRENGLVDALMREIAK